MPMRSEMDTSMLAAEARKESTVDKAVRASGWIDGGAILYGLITGAVGAVVLGLSGLMLKQAYLRGRKK